MLTYFFVLRTDSFCAVELPVASYFNLFKPMLVSEAIVQWAWLVTKKNYGNWGMKVSRRTPTQSTDENDWRDPREITLGNNGNVQAQRERLKGGWMVGGGPKRQTINWCERFIKSVKCWNCNKVWNVNEVNYCVSNPKQQNIKYFMRLCSHRNV